MVMRNIVLIALGTVILGIIALVVTSKSADKEVVKKVEPESVNVLVAKVDILPGAYVNPDTHLAFVPIKKDLIQPGYVLEGSTPMQHFSGAVARMRIYSGEPVNPEHLVKPDSGGFMAAVLKQGMRAITVAVTPVSGIAGFIFPGDKVDVILSRAGTPEEGSLRRTIVKSARVLAMDQKYAVSDSQLELPKYATLEAKPEDVEAIAIASELGKISLALVSSAKAQGKAEVAESGVVTESHNQE